MNKKYEQTHFDKQAQDRIKFVIDSYFGGSQQTLSETCGVHKASVSQYVNGKNVPSNITAKKICDPIGLNPAWLMGFDVPMFSPSKLPGEMGVNAERISAYLQELESIVINMSEEYLKKVVDYAERLYANQRAEEELI